MFALNSISVAYVFTLLPLRQIKTQHATIKLIFIKFIITYPRRDYCYVRPPITRAFIIIRSKGVWSVNLDTKLSLRSKTEQTSKEHIRYVCGCATLFQLWLRLPSDLILSEFYTKILYRNFSSPPFRQCHPT
jgi:hypothetical protein